MDDGRCYFFWRLSFLFNSNKPNLDINYVPQKFTSLLLRWTNSVDAQNASKCTFRERRRKRSLFSALWTSLVMRVLKNWSCEVVTIVKPKKRKNKTKSVSKAYLIPCHTWLQECISICRGAHLKTQYFPAFPVLCWWGTAWHFISIPSVTNECVGLKVRWPSSKSSSIVFKNKWTSGTKPRTETAQLKLAEPQTRRIYSHIIWGWN